MFACSRPSVAAAVAAVVAVFAAAVALAVVVVAAHHVGVVFQLSVDERLHRIVRTALHAAVELNARLLQRHARAAADGKRARVNLPRLPL